MAVVRLGSFAAAARERNVDPLSVSRVIAGLEAELGVRLFQRSTRQLALTDAGALCCFALVGFRDCWCFTPKAGGPTLEVPIQPRLQTSNGLALCDLALAGVGPTLLPGWLVDDDIRAGRLVDLYPEHDVAVYEAPGGAWIVYPSRSYVPAKVRVFIELLRAAVDGGR